VEPGKGQGSAGTATSKMDEILLQRVDVILSLRSKRKRKLAAA